MTEYVERDLAEKALLQRCEETGYGGLNRDDVRLVMRTPWRTPAADVVERKHGKWEDVLFGWECSVCHVKQEYSVFFDFCPNCGADMRAEEEPK